MLLSEAPKTSELDIQGMTCASCVRRVEKALSKVPGVADAAVNYATERARVIHVGSVPDATLIQAVENAGYGATSHDRAPVVQEEKEGNPELTRLILAATLTVPAILLSMLWPMRPFWANWLLFALATPVVFYCGKGFFSSAWKAGRHGSAGMDTLVALGAGAAWASSVYGLLAVQGHMQSEFVYFETGATIVTLILFGRYLEFRAKRSMSGAIGKLMDLAPKMAHLVLASGLEVDVAASSLQPGDRVRVKPGEKAPVDGVVEGGESYFDESLLTGEPVPVRRIAGDSLVGGSLNGNGSVVYHVTRVLTESRLAQIARLVEEAQGSKAPVQKLADSISSVFVPVVILIALATFLVRLLGLHQSFAEAMLPAIAVLVIACPCALGLATPTAIVAGTGRGAQLGILIRDGSALESTRTLKTILLDKTGTITEGKPSVVEMEAEREVLQLAGSLETLSEHPLGKAMVDRCRQDGVELLQVTDFEAKTGYGVSGSVGSQIVKVGNRSFVGEIPENLSRKAEDWESQGHTVIWISIGDRVKGALAVSDPIRPTSAEAISEIRALGLTPVMVTGDRASTAKSIASQVGIKEFRAEVSPEDKAEIVARYGGGVAMVGDGINDAPALAAADVGIAMGAGSDIAKETAGITLLRNDLRAVPEAISLARATLRTIHQNLIWAFGYNLVAIPIAVAGHLNPMIASGAMAFSSLSVVFNSLRLKRFG